MRLVKNEIFKPKGVKMKRMNYSKKATVLLLSAAVLSVGVVNLYSNEEKTSSYAPIVVKENFESTMKRMKAEKPKIEERHNTLLKERYDLSDRASNDVTMSGGKPVQDGVRVILPTGMTWENFLQ